MQGQHHSHIVGVPQSNLPGREHKKQQSHQVSMLFVPSLVWMQLELNPSGSGKSMDSGTAASTGTGGDAGGAQAMPGWAAGCHRMGIRISEELRVRNSPAAFEGSEAQPSDPGLTSRQVFLAPDLTRALRFLFDSEDGRALYLQSLDAISSSLKFTELQVFCWFWWCLSLPKPEQEQTLSNP